VRALQGRTLQIGLLAAILVVAVARFGPAIFSGSRRSKAETRDPAFRGPAPTSLPSVDLVDPSGDTVRVTFTAARPVLLLLHSPHCPACRSIVSTWEGLCNVLAGGTEVHLLNVDPHTIPDSAVVLPPGWRTSTCAPGLWQAVSPSEIQTALGVRAVPTTILAGRDGRILFTKVGPLDTTDTAALLDLAR
jgi:hypothetical protein